ncbi:MAG TPA: hypothetical protein VM864_04655 [Pyrinomonadaceae bacterium]|jgi:hypothetical protein|nr:hypothetical protein [Pyrinomonadaceae bacterium]
MRKTLATALCCLVVATLAAAAVFAGGPKAEALTDDGGGQERQWEREARPVRYEPFGVEVIVGGSPLEQLPARGRVYVEAVAGSEYALRVRNPLPVRVAVALSVDGLNTIDARRTTARDASKWVVEPYGTITVTGWQMSRTRARSFYFTSERDSYANKLGRAQDVGVITAAFFRERAGYSEVVPPPRPLESRRRDEAGEMKSAPQPSQSARSAGVAKERAAAPARDDEYAATGIGRSVGNDVRWVNLDLERDPAAEVTIRYEYRPALVRLGVLPRPDIQPDPLRRRERARGFAEDPRFCPDPKQ